VNGKSVKICSGLTGPLQSTRNELYFGLNLVDLYITGMISDVRVWKRVMSSEDIQQSMVTQAKIDSEDLIGWWPLDHGNGTEAYDRSKHLLTGKLANAEWINKGRIVTVPALSTLAQDLKSMFNNSMGSDIMMRASDADPDSFIYAHKIILCSRSEVFKTMLMDAQDSTSKMLTLQDITASVLQHMLEFIYTDNIEINEDIVLDLYTAADKYHLPRLKYLCEIFMQKNIRLENVCVILKAADMFHARFLRNECIKWIVDNFGVVLSSEWYLNVPKNLMAEINQAAAAKWFPQNTGNNNKKRKLFQVRETDLNDDSETNTDVDMVIIQDLQG